MGAGAVPAVNAFRAASTSSILLDTELDEPDVGGGMPNELLDEEKRTDVPKYDDIELDAEPDEQDKDGELSDEFPDEEEHSDDPEDDNIKLDTALDEQGIEGELPDELLDKENSLVTRKTMASSSIQS